MNKVIILCLFFLIGCECIKSECKGAVKDIEFKVFQQNGAFEHPPKIYTFITYADGTKNIYNYKKELKIGEPDCECVDWGVSDKDKQNPTQ